MEKKKETMWLVLTVTMAVVAFALPAADATISCGTVADILSPCINYVLYGGAAPPENCCQGIKTLYNQASATADRQGICSCLKSVAGSATPAIINNAATLPEKCGISIPYKISPSTDCTKVH